MAPSPLAALDRYELQHLTSHLASAGLEDELHRLLSVEWEPGDHPVTSSPWARWMPEARKASAEHMAASRIRPEPRVLNAWYEARDREGQFDGYLDDLAIADRAASRTAVESVGAGVAAPGVGLELRYALMGACITSMAGGLSAELLRLLVLRGRWTPAQALAYARRHPDGDQRVMGVAGLVDQFPAGARGALVDEALRLLEAHDLPEWTTGTATWTWLSPQVRVLEYVAAELDQGQLQRALNVARAIRDLSVRCEALAVVGPVLPQATMHAVFEEAIDCLDASSSADAIRVFAGRAPADLLARALEKARAIEHRYQRVEALGALLPHVPPAERPGLLDEMRANATALDASQWLDLRVEIAAYLDDAERDEVTAAICARSADDEQTAALAGLLPHLSGAVRAQAVARARADVEAMTAEFGEYKAEAIARVAPYVEEPALVPLLREGLAAAYAMGVGERQGAVLALAPLLPPELLEDAIALATAFEGEYFLTLRIRALAALARLVPDVLPPEDLEDLASVAGALTEEHQEYVLPALQALREPLSTPPRTVPAGGPIRSSIAGRAARAVLRRPLDLLLWRWCRTADARVLALALPFLPALSTRALDLAAAVEDEIRRYLLLRQLLSSVPLPVGRRLAERALEKAPLVTRWFSEETPYPLQNVARRELLEVLLPLLPDDSRTAMLSSTVQDVGSMTELDDRRRRLSLLASLLVDEPLPERYHLWRTTLDLLARHRREDLLADVAALAPLIASLGGEAAVTEVARAVGDASDWWP